MDAVARGQTYDLHHPRTTQAVRSVKAKDVFDAIVEAAWRAGDPGILFLDAINRANPTPRLGPIEATNPCGEIPLLPYESCNLGSINVASFVVERDGRAVLDWEQLRTTVRTAVRFLDNVIEVNAYPFPEIERITRGNRKIGLGMMGFADALIRIGLPYDSEEAVGMADQLMHTLADEARAASESLARERGVFPNWSGSTLEGRGLRLRNATRTAIAPTGTISIIAGTSASIEPLFALAYRRRHTLGGPMLTELNPLLVTYCEEHHLDAAAIMDEVARSGRLHQRSGVPETLTRLFLTALEIPVERHLQIQAAYQRHVDNSVSKTINLPREATPQDVAFAYQRAWELGLKGVTIYRYGSKSTQVLDLGLGEETYHYDHASRCDPSECKV
jgi:ribonucleoside-diphosphate reductase alpha chain